MGFISIKNAGFFYNNTPIFEGISLDLEKGGIFCLLGPNGSGKTTFIDALFGIHPLSCGDIFLNHENIKQLSPKQIARILAYVPQKHSRHFSFSVMDILLMGRTAHTSLFGSPDRKDRQAVLEILRRFDMFHLKDRDYTRLSGGETQLVMIMRALVQDTPVIVMDEPTSHLDFKHEITVLETIVRLVRQQKKTLIMATHFPNHAFFLENEGLNIEVAFLHNQQMFLSGTPSNALTHENITAFYGVETAIIEHQSRENGTLKQIFPIRTSKENK